MKNIEIRAHSVVEAIRLALVQLGKDRDEVAIEVLEKGSADEEALVRVTIVDDDEELVDAPAPMNTASDVEQLARHILEDLLERMDIQGYVTAIRSTVPDQRGEPEDTITLHVEGADEEAMSLMIGRRGETLRSVQFMVNLLVSRRVQKWPQIVVDVGNYRQRRQESLEGLARRMAERVRQTHRPLMLEPMGAYERRIVHLTLRSDVTVYTESTGEGENRKIVIYPKQ
jgi:spoIIIJ-associated protein